MPSAAPIRHLHFNYATLRDDMPYGYHGPKILTSLSHRFQDFKRWISFYARTQLVNTNKQFSLSQEKRFLAGQQLIE